MTSLILIISIHKRDRTFFFFFFPIFGVDIFGGVSRLHKKRLPVPLPRSFGYIWDEYRDAQTPSAALTLDYVEKSDTVKDKKALHYVSCCNNSKTGTRSTRNELDNLTYQCSHEGGQKGQEKANQVTSYVKPLSLKNI